MLVDSSIRISTYRYEAANQLTAVTYSDGTTPKRNVCLRRRRPAHEHVRRHPDQQLQL
jgi:hypothetical protein